jgi:simple sugar transport system ATP-binding protein
MAVGDRFAVLNRGRRLGTRRRGRITAEALQDPIDGGPQMAAPGESCGGTE